MTTPRHSSYPPELALALALALASVLTACEGKPETAIIGFGDRAVRRNAVRVARDEISEWRMGRVEIRILHDSLEVPGAGVAEQEALRAERLLRAGPLVGVVGPGSSRGALAASPIYNQAGLVHLVPNATSRLLRDLGPWSFALAPNDSIMGAFIGDFIANTLGSERASVFYVSTEYGYGLRDGVSASLAGRGVDLVDAVPYDLESDFDVLVTASLARGIPGVIVIAGREPGAIEIIRRVQDAHPEIAYVAGDGLVLTADLLAVGSGVERLYVADFWHRSVADSASQAFRERYLRVVGTEPGGSSAIRHDALMILATAVREVGTSAGAIRAFLEDSERSRKVYRGVSGEPAYREGADYKLYMVRAVDGRLVTLPEHRP